jgi:hypothetical protein
MPSGDGVAVIELLNSRLHFWEELIAMAAQDPAGPLLSFCFRAILQ